jgi:hypothetical protein
LSRAIAIATAKYLGVRLTVACWQHVAITIGNKYLRKANRIWKQKLEEDEKGEKVERESNNEIKQNLFEYILVRQSAYSRQTVARHYAIDGAFLNRLGPDLVNIYSQVSRV